MCTYCSVDEAPELVEANTDEIGDSICIYCDNGTVHTFLKVKDASVFAQLLYVVWNYSVSGIALQVWLIFCCVSHWNRLVILVIAGAHCAKVASERDTSARPDECIPPGSLDNKYDIRISVG